jgi:hypothetical protein
MDTVVENNVGDRTLFWAAGWVLAGALLSGPLGLVVTLFDPQPVWTDARTFIDHYRPWHQTPFWFGFVFIAAWVALNSRLAAIAPDAQRGTGFAALVGTAIYGAMIATNYMLQVAYVPLAVATSDSNVSYATMANPASLAWALEMFGYGALGVANWLTADLFPEGPPQRRWVVRLMYANGVVGVFGPVMIAIDVRWVQTATGLTAYLGWNVLVVVTAATIATVYRPRRSAVSQAALSLR